MSDIKIGAVIVAGGLSSRMNHFKPLLPIGNKTMIETTINNYIQFGVDEIVVVTGYRSEDIETKLENYDVVCIKNENYENTHMFDSVCIGLNHIKNKVDCAFILPADSPFVQQFTLNKMMEEIKNSNSNLLQPSFEGIAGHPLLVRNTVFDKILYHDGTKGLQGAISNMGMDYKNIELVDSGIILDADTTNDYLKLLRFNENKNCPSIEMCEKIQDYFYMSESVKKHSETVALVALYICDNLYEEGIFLDKKKVMAASLLHDVAKGLNKHAEAGAEWLLQMGYHGISEIVKEHMELTRISHMINEKEVVYLADKLVKGETLVSIKERFSFKENTFKNDADVIKSIEKRKEQAEFLYYMLLENEGRYKMKADFRE